MSGTIELPRFRCHKIVHAAKIVAIEFGERLDLAPHGVIEVGADWIANRKASVGGYFVQYDDGYTSFSPAKAFEEGYTWDPLIGDQAVETEIQVKGLTAPRITPADIEANIRSETYFDGNGVSPISKGLAITGPALGLLTFCVLVLRNGFTVTGESACASPENFNAALGQKIARANAISKVWPLMGYQLKEQLYQRTQPAQIPVPTLTMGDALADLAGTPRPDNPTV